MSTDEYFAARQAMVDRQIVARGIKSSSVIAAMRKVPRERFIANTLRPNAYDDRPLPIPDGQTISQPYIVALMADLLRLTGNERVLEIGTGSGYATAVIAELANRVISIERIKQLADRARLILAELDYNNVVVNCCDGTLGSTEFAPYDAIVVTAGGPKVPPPLQDQLAIGGRLVIPVGETPHHQSLVRVTKIAESDFKTETVADVRFVSLIGREGW